MIIPLLIIGFFLTYGSMQLAGSPRWDWVSIVLILLAACCYGEVIAELLSLAF